MAAPRYRRLTPGDVAPWFKQRSSINQSFSFDTVGGRYVLMAFIGSAADAAGRRAAAFLDELGSLLDDDLIAGFLVTHDPQDEAQARVRQRLPGVRVFWDFDGTIGRLYGALPVEAKPGDRTPIRRPWFLIDPQLRVLIEFPSVETEVERLHVRRALERIRQSPPDPDAHAPVLRVKRIFEPELCEALVDYYEAHGGEDSGFMRDIDGKTVLINDPSHKRRSDRTIEDEVLLNRARTRIQTRLAPMIERAFAFKPTRIERHIVACYDSERRGHFRAHRDNTTKGTAHRRFAVTVNLNDAFEGGTLSFPEFGPRAYKPEPGEAVVFSCALLHAVSPVEQGIRYAYLPFLYDEAAAKIRDETRSLVDNTRRGPDGKPLEPAAA